MKARLITLNVNGEEHSVIVDDRDTLLHVLRKRLLLTGTKKHAAPANAAPAPCFLTESPCLPVSRWRLPLRKKVSQPPKAWRMRESSPRCSRHSLSTALSNAGFAPPA